MFWRVLVRSDHGTCCITFSSFDKTTYDLLDESDEVEMEWKHQDDGDVLLSVGVFLGYCYVT